MRFIELNLQNFLSFGTVQTIALEKRGLVAILGQNKDSGNADSNGSGKSAIMEAIVWCLWGETLRGLKADEVINDRVGKDCKVSLVIEDSGKSYKITRFRGMSKVKKPNDLILEINGAPADSSTAGVMADTQEMVNVIIGMNMKTFIQSVMLSYGTVPFSELTDSAQKAVLEDILQIEILSKARQLVSKRINERQLKLAGVNTELRDVSIQLDHAVQRQQKINQAVLEHTTMLAQRKKELLNKKLACDAKLEDQWHRDGLDKLIDALNDAKERSQQLDGAFGTMNNERMHVIRSVAAIRNGLMTSKGDLSSQIRQLQQNYKNVNSLVGATCPVCFQAVVADKVELLFSTWDEATAKAQENLRTIDVQLNAIDTKEAQQLAECQQKEINVREQYKTAQAIVLQLQQKVNERSAQLSLIQQLEQQSFQLALEIDKLDEEENPYSAMLQDVVSEIKKLKTQQTKLNYSQRSLSLEIQHLTFWDHGFGNHGIKSYMLDSVLPFLNTRAQYYADIMSGGDLQITFSTQRQLKSGQWKDEFQVEVVNKQGANVYKGNSAGEKRRSDIAVGWALGDLAAQRATKPIRFKSLDEPFENLDESGEEGVIRLLHTVVQQYETIMCITHSDSLKSSFPEVLTVVKENGSSRVL
jgi:DNA repair exonuclease SbcCD ATPase subunit